MKVIELFEVDILADLEKVMKLRATAAHISQEKAEECFKWLASEGYRWALEQSHEGVHYLHIALASMKKQAWRNAPGMRERREIAQKLAGFGYSTAPFRTYAAAQKPQNSYGPHVYFW